MAYAIQQASTPVFSRLAVLFDGLAQKQTQRAEELRVQRELSMLSDRELNDIGVARGEIARIAKASLAH